METEKKMYRHKGGHVTAIVLTVLMFAAVLFFNYLSSSTMGQKLGLYVSSTGDVSDRFYLEITPAGWTFTIWAFIYLWQGTWLLYGFASIFRKLPDGYMYQTPPVIQLPTYIVYMFNLGFNIGWVFLFDRGLIIPSLVFIVLIPLTLIACLILEYRRIGHTYQTLTSHGKQADVWLVRILVHNGLAFYCGWVSVASFLNAAMVLVHILEVANDVACTVALALLAFFLVLYFCLDMFLLDRFTRYQFSNYIPVIMALGGSIAKNYERVGPSSRNPIFTVVLLAVALTCFVVKMIVLIVRHVRDPLANGGSVSDINPIALDEKSPAETKQGIAA
ncbi:uncharacterized protein LOC141907356 [Tubulanus polymorphus]|uniref:uncharacterized protein LOC141907356 n=1 Tax=Tubulanus polymorphus TaxID=672921 RepID=UPI003DA6B4A8